MKTPAHMLLGAAIGAAPDALLILFGWRKDWLPESHPLVRAHRFLHSSRSIPVVIATAAWCSHLLADRYSEHRTEETRRGRFL